MKKKDLLIPIVMLAIGAGVGFLARDRPAAGNDARTTLQQGTAVVDPEAKSQDTPAQAVAPQSVPASRPPVIAQRHAAAAATLPPMDAPVVEVIASLRARAMAGDNVAACRLAADLMLCDWWQPDYGERELASIDPDKAKTKQDLAGMEWQLKIAAAGQLRKRRCAGVSDSAASESGRWLRAAARAGHVPSMHAYANSAGVPHTKFLSRLDELAIYRDEAAVMLESAARAGSLSAVHSLSMVLADDGSGALLGEIYASRNDPVDALSYQMLFAMALQPKETKPANFTAERLTTYRDQATKRGALSAAQIDSAEQRAQERFLTWFGGRRAPMQTMDMMPFGMGIDDGRRPINDVCSDGPWTTPPTLPVKHSQ